MRFKSNQIFLKLGLESKIKKGLSRRGAQEGIASQYNKGIVSQHSTFQSKRGRILTFDISGVGEGFHFVLRDCRASPAMTQKGDSPHFTQKGDSPLFFP